MNRHFILHRVVPVAAALAVGGGIGAGIYAGVGGGSSSPKTVTTVDTSTVQPAASTQTISSLSQLYKTVTPGVVDITVTESSSSGFGFGQQTTQAEGTGFVYDTKGDIITAAHVVDGETSIKVHFKDGTTANATLVGKDDSTDTAVIKVSGDASELHPLSIGSSASLEPGAEVVAIGSPFGLTESMTAGIVSAVGRTITAPNNFSISGAIQTDAPINHGNSGGPLLTTNGDVVGVNVQIDSNSDGSEGVGFATPIDTVKSVANTLISGGTVEHAYLGIQVGDAANSGGAQVSCVVGNSPADNAGLKAGDVITAVGSTPVTSADDLTAAVNSYKPGDKTTITVTSSGSKKTLNLTFGSRPTSSSTCS
ncbi:MAG: trypsin-like peptidase domain-containing protein [Actinobacteria bacterium]|nr:trypsin-like peptidase domain-containing protein [Actinomycetota bacterium]MBV8478832.1 trypsin-like peptidase domain-containing protein [Actinomycetota bacterium]